MPHRESAEYNTPAYAEQVFGEVYRQNPEMQGLPGLGEALRAEWRRRAFWLVSQGVEQDAERLASRVRFNLNKPRPAPGETTVAGLLAKAIREKEATKAGQARRGPSNVPGGEIELAGGFTTPSAPSAAPARIRDGFDPTATVATTPAEERMVLTYFEPAWGGYYVDKFTGALVDSATGDPVPSADAARYFQWSSMRDLARESMKMRNASDLALSIESVRGRFELQVADLREAAESERALAERALAGKNLDEAIRHNRALEGLEARRQDADDKRFRAQLLLSLAADPLLLRLARDTPLVRMLAEGLGIDMTQLSQLGIGQAPGAPAQRVRQEVR